MRVVAGLILLLLLAGSSQAQSGPAAGRLTPQMFGAIANDDGDDAPALNRMAERAAATGRPAIIPAGTYILNAPLLIRSNLTILGSGNVVLLAGPSLPASGGLVRTPVWTAGTGRYAQAHVTLRGLTFDGGNKPYGGDYFLVQLMSVDGLTITNCLFRNHRHGLLAIGGSRAVRLADDRFRNWGRTEWSPSGGAGLWVSGNPVPTDQTPGTDVRATNLDFRDAEWSAVYLFARGAIFHGGTIHNVKEGGFYGAGVDPGCVATTCRPNATSTSIDISGYTISHVRRKDVASNGFEFGGKDINIHDNVVFDTEGPGISLNWPIDGARIERNIVYDTVKAAGADPNWKTYDNYGQILLIQRAGAIRNVLIAGNHIGKPGLKPIARNAIRFVSLGEGDHMDNIVVTGNDMRFAFAREPYGFRNQPFLRSDARSRLTGNTGAPDVRAAVEGTPGA